MKKLLKIFLSLILLLSFVQNGVLSAVSAAEPTEIQNPPSEPVGLTVVPRDSQVELSWKAGLGKQILFVGTGNQADEQTMKHLESLGFSVTFKEDKEVSGDNAPSYDLVFVGESSNSANIGKKFMNFSVPIVYAEPFALDDVHLSKSASGSFGSYENQESLKINASNHPLAAGLNRDRKSVV